jgi:hypothetical protein
MKLNWIICKKCQKKFYAKDDILQSQLPLHCPFCDSYFHLDSEKSKRGETKDRQFK